MSLLEDVFLQDEANEAEQLERVIEGDEFEERRRSDSDDNSEKEDEAEEDKRKVDPTKAKATRVVKNPRFLLNPARLTGPRGIKVIPEHFKDFKFKGKGHEKEDLDLVLKKLEHWAYRLYPKFQFEDCLKKIEMLGKKRPVAVHLHKIRSDQFLSEDTVVQKDSSDEETPVPVQEDEFDKLLQQQIDLARSTPAPNSAKKPDFNGLSTEKDKRISSIMMPKATSSPSISDEQRERMLRNRRLAEERRLARLKNTENSSNTIPQSSSQPINVGIGTEVENVETNTVQNNGIVETNQIEVVRKHNRSNVIDSSDEETVAETHVSIAVDVHAVNREVPTNDNTSQGTKNSQKESLPSDIEEINISNEPDKNMNICESNKENKTTSNESKISCDDNKGHSTDMEEVNDISHQPDEYTPVRESSTDINNKNATKELLEGSSLKINSDENKENQSMNTEVIEMLENSVDNNSAENEELRYDDSDININTHNTSDNIEKENELQFEKAPTNNECISNTEVVEVAEISAKETKVTNKENDLSENILDDVMDVDFSDDF